MSPVWFLIPFIMQTTCFSIFGLTAMFPFEQSESEHPYSFILYLVNRLVLSAISLVCFFFASLHTTAKALTAIWTIQPYKEAFFDYLRRLAATLGLRFPQNSDGNAVAAPAALSHAARERSISVQGISSRVGASQVSPMRELDVSTQSESNRCL